MSSEEQIKSRRFYDDENDSGFDRLKKFYKDVFSGVPRAEWEFVTNNVFYSFLGGGFYRLSFGSDMILKEFKAKHNTSIFLGKTDLKRQLLNFTIEKVGQRCLQFGTKCGVLAGIISLLTVNSFVYRKDFKIPDVTLATGVSYGLTRYNRGLRSILSSFTIGFAFGLVSSCIIKAFIYTKDISFKDWLDERNYELTKGDVFPVVPVEEDAEES